jgi:hypothetical protein
MAYPAPMSFPNFDQALSSAGEAQCIHQSTPPSNPDGQNIPPERWLRITATRRWHLTPGDSVLTCQQVAALHLIFIPVGLWILGIISCPTTIPERTTIQAERLNISTKSPIQDRPSGPQPRRPQPRVNTMWLPRMW